MNINDIKELLVSENPSKFLPIIEKNIETISKDENLLNAISAIKETNSFVFRNCFACFGSNLLEPSHSIQLKQIAQKGAPEDSSIIIDATPEKVKAVCESLGITL
jgi:hypothetical protein